MQIQTTTATTQHTQAAGAAFKVTIFEQTTTVFCDACANQSTGTRDELKRQGWFLGRREAFCPCCDA